MIFYISLFVLIGGVIAAPNPTLTDAIPIVSQAKYLILYAIGEPEQAQKTWNNFKNMTHLWESVKNADENIPIVGHVESAVYLINGDPERAKEIVAKANKSTLVLGCFIMSGPAGAFGGGIIADSANSLFLQKPMGIVDTVVHFKDKNVSDRIDAVLDIVVDTSVFPGSGKINKVTTKGTAKTIVKLEMKRVKTAILNRKNL